MIREHEQNLTAEVIVILTESELIEGTYFHHRNVRLSDSLNGPDYREKPYIALADATITSRQTGQELLQAQFLLVSHSKVLAMMPKPAITTCPMIHDWVKAPESKYGEFVS